MPRCSPTVPPDPARSQPGTASVVWNGPNAVTALRLALVPTMLVLAWIGARRAYLATLVGALLSDVLDGWLARRMGQSTELGAKLDSTADLLATLSVPVSVWWLWPEVLRREIGFIVVGLCAYVVPLVVGWLKFRQLTSYHTWGAKTMAVTLGIAVFVLLIGWTPWPFRCLIPLAVLEAAEEIAMTMVLPERRSNVPTLWHAWRLRRQLLAERQNRRRRQGGAAEEMR